MFVPVAFAARASLDALLPRLNDLEIDRSPADRPVRVEVDPLLRLAIGRARRRHIAGMAPPGKER